MDIARFFPEPSATARGEYFVQVRESYLLAAKASGYAGSQSVNALLASVPPRTPGQLSKVYAKDLGEAVTWGDCYILELDTVAALPNLLLPAMLRQQRIRYEQIAPDSEYSDYLKGAADIATLLTTSSSTAFDDLRAELFAVTERIIYYLTASAPKESQRGWLTLYTTILMLAGMGLIFLWYVGVYQTAHEAEMRQFRPTESLFLVMFAGLVGGFVSVQQRLQQPTNVDPIYKRVELEASGFSLLVSPVIGMIFAVVLFVAMMGHIVDTNLFPTFACPKGSLKCTGQDLAFFSASASPADAASWARLALWSFAAGFLERLVPDILTRIASVATDSK